MMETAEQKDAKALKADQRAGHARNSRNKGRSYMKQPK
jgi:hypothetical protein